VNIGDLNADLPQSELVAVTIARIPVNSAGDSGVTSTTHSK
jgi:hypothetical protein